jgi:hypothetical protein
MQHITRRNFLKGSVATGVGLALASPFSRVRGANDDIRVAVVGINGRGGSHIDEFRKMAGVRLAALCDVDRKVLERGAKLFADKNEKVGRAYEEIGQPDKAEQVYHEFIKSVDPSDPRIETVKARLEKLGITSDN